MSRQPSIPDVKDFADVAQWLLRFVMQETPCLIPKEELL